MKVRRVNTEKREVRLADGSRSAQGLTVRAV
jgi:hypothetical protein